MDGLQARFDGVPQVRDRAETGPSRQLGRVFAQVLHQRNNDADYADRSLLSLSHGVLLVFGAPPSLIAGRAGARPDYPITGQPDWLNDHGNFDTLCLGTARTVWQPIE